MHRACAFGARRYFHIEAKPVSIPIYFWFPVLGCSGIGFIFMCIPPVADQFMGLFGVGYGGLSFFFSAIYWTHSACQVPAGLLVDRLGALKSLALCLLLIFVGNTAPLLAPDSLALAVSMRLLTGLGTGTLFLVLIKILNILTPPGHIGRAQGAQGAAFCLGTMLPYLTLPYAGKGAWLLAYLSGAAFCLVVAVLALRLPREPLRTVRSTGSLGQTWQAVKTISTSRHILFMGCCHGFTFGSLNTLGNWMPSILADRKAGSTIEDWALATSLILLLGTLGRMFSGDAAKLMPRQTLISRITLGVGVLFLVLAASGSPLAALVPALLLAGLSGCMYASVFTLTIDMSAPSYAATAAGFMNMVGNGVNILLILVLGNAREFTGSFGPGLVISGVTAIGLWYLGRRIQWPTAVK